MKVIAGLAHRFRRLRDDERGATIVLFAAGLTALAGAAALAVDAGYLYTMKNKNQATADAAALAGAQRLPADVLVKQEANTYAGLNMPSSAFGDTLADPDIRLGAWDPATRTFDASATGTDINAVEVLNQQSAQQSNPVGLFFARVFGRETADVRARAVASWIKSDTTLNGCFMALEPLNPRAFELSSNGANINNGPGCDVIACSKAYDTPPAGYSEPVADDLNVNVTAMNARSGSTIGPSCDPTVNGRIATGSGEFGFAVNTANYCEDLGRIQCPVDSSGASTVFKDARDAAATLASTYCTAGGGNGGGGNGGGGNDGGGGGGDGNTPFTAWSLADTNGVVCLNPQADLPNADVDFGSGYLYVVTHDWNFKNNQYTSGSASTNGSLFILTNNAKLTMNSNTDIEFRGYDGASATWCSSVGCDKFTDLIIVEEGTSTASNPGHKINGNAGGAYDGAIVLPNSRLQVNGGSETGALSSGCSVIIAKTVDFSGGGVLDVDSSGCSTGLQDTIKVDLLKPALVQ